MKKIILKNRVFKVSDDAFYESGLDKLTVSLNRGQHPRRDMTEKVRAICEDLMQVDTDACFLIGTGCRSKEERDDYRDGYFGLGRYYIAG